MKFSVIALLVIFLSVSHGANIAMFMTMGSHSHFNVYTAFAKVLIEDGHNITFFNSVVDTKFTNFTSIRPKVFSTPRKFNDTLFQERLDRVHVSGADLPLFDASIKMCQIFLESEEVKNVVKSNIHFDLVVINPLFAECGFVLGYHYNAPVVYLGSSGIYARTGIVFANPGIAVYKSDVIVHGSQNVLDFSQRFISAIALFGVRMMQLWYMYPKTDVILRKHFGPDVPSIVEMEQNASLLFLNTNIGVDLPTPYMPNIVEIAGLHCEPAKQLSDQFSDFVENSDGVVLFSLGSLVKAAHMPNSFRKALLDAFSQLPYRIIWKWENEHMDGFTIPRNVMITKWIPQNDLLGHKKTKLFITHGGKQSTVEALYHEVPVIVVPIFADQDLHAFLAHERGYGVILEAEDLESSQKVLDALTTVLNDKKFEVNVKKFSAIMKDQLLSPKERVSYWINYVLRHKGIPLMKFPARSMNWIQYYQVDVIVVIGPIVIITTILLVKIFAVFLRKLFGSK